MRFWLQTLAWLAGMLAVLEILCRLALGHPPRTRFDPRYDRITAAHQPIVQASEGFSRGVTNELGHLDAPMPAELPRDAILVIGDSLTEGRQVEMSARFTDRLGALLGTRVYNVGHTGWSPLNAIGFLRAEVQTFRPATVIVQVSGNDLDDMTSRKRPHLVERHDAFEIEWPKRTAGRGLARVREALSRSALASDLVVRATMMFADSDDEGALSTSCEQPAALVVRALPWVVAQLHAAHPDVRLLYLPVLDYHAGCVDTCVRARDLWERAARDAHVPLVDVTDAMCRRFRDTRQPLNGFWNTIPGTGHLNADGHAVVADELAAALHRSARR